MKSQMHFSFVCAVLFFLLFSACSDNGSSAENVFDASVVCPAEGKNVYGEPNRGTFTDARDGHVYKYTTIGNRVWMAENLNYDVEFGLTSCVVKDDCSSKGRVYGVVNSLGACPEGWHLPSNDEWAELFDNVGGSDSAGIRLKATSGWIPLNPGQLSNGTDDCGFALLPMPTGIISSGRVYDGYEARLWATDVALVEAYINGREFREDDTMTGVLFETQYVYARASRFYGAAIRCIRDNDEN